MAEILGVLAAVLSSMFGGTSIVATRYIVGVLDPLAIGTFRFGLGFAFLLPIALAAREKWPQRRDWPGVLGLGLLFFALFPFLFNWSLAFTTAARAALALSTMPLLTMATAAALGIEAFTARKAIGVAIATAGVTVALISGLREAPPDAWKGDLLMVAAALSMSLYNVWSKPFIARSGPMSFAAAGMAVGAATLIVLSLSRDAFAPVPQFGPGEWGAVLYLGIFGGALTFFLWAFALGRTTPTRVAISVTINPIIAGIAGAALLHEPLSWNLVLGLVAVGLGIWITTATSLR